MTYFAFVKHELPRTQAERSKMAAGLRAMAARHASIATTIDFLPEQRERVQASALTAMLRAGLIENHGQGWRRTA